jgi:branched-chain amino acid transport system permease protein
MQYFLMQAANGLTMGSIYALMALGLTVIFSVLKIINFSHGEFYIIGGYLSYYFFVLTGLPTFLCIVFALIILVFIGSLFERLFLGPIHQDGIERPEEYALLITFGLSYFLQNLALCVFGPFPKKPPGLSEGIYMIGFLIIGKNRVIAGAVAILLILILSFVINKTWIGKGLRAVSQDKEAAAAVGIDAKKMYTVAFGIGAALAGGAGALMGPMFSISPTSGLVPAIRSFVIIVLGGMGSVKGAIFGGLIIGLVESLGSGYFPDPSRSMVYQPVFGLVIFALLLLIKPSGLFGEEQ